MCHKNEAKEEEEGKNRGRKAEEPRNAIPRLPQAFYLGHCPFFARRYLENPSLANLETLSRVFCKTTMRESAQTLVQNRPLELEKQSGPVNHVRLNGAESVKVGYSALQVENTLLQVENTQTFHLFGGGRKNRRKQKEREEKQTNKALSPLAVETPQQWRCRLRRNLAGAARRGRRRKVPRMSGLSQSRSSRGGWSSRLSQESMSRHSWRGPPQT